jgi:hypothetical protein
MLVEQNRLLDALAELLGFGASNAASGKVQKRLEEMAGFYLTIGRSMNMSIRHWRASRLR